MDVQLRKTMPGCISIPCNIITLGLFSLLLKSGEGHFPARVSEEGIETRSGKKFAWSDFTRMQRVKVVAQGSQLSDEILLYAPKGKVSLHYGRMIDAPQIIQYALQRLPQNIQQG